MESAPSALHEHCVCFYGWKQFQPHSTSLLLYCLKICKTEVQTAHPPFLKINPLKITDKPPMTSTDHGLGSQMETQSLV